jgi:hypothetical protein
MLAYVFWHWPRPNVAAEDYETRQRAFHEALKAAPSAGFLHSFTHAFSGAPWAGGGLAYEDWYLVEDSAALDHLNDAAVSASRQAPHDLAAAAAAGGTAGLYALRMGEVHGSYAVSNWFSKPDGMPYDALFAALAPVVKASRGALWMRRMTLGPATEFCLQSTEPVPLPPAILAQTFVLRAVYPEAIVPASSTPAKRGHQGIP